MDLCISQLFFENICTVGIVTSTSLIRSRRSVSGLRSMNRRRRERRTDHDSFGRRNRRVEDFIDNISALTVRFFNGGKLLSFLIVVSFCSFAHCSFPESISFRMTADFVLQ